MTFHSDAHLHAPKLSVRAVVALAGGSIIAAAIVAGLGAISAQSGEQLIAGSAPEVAEVELPTYALEEGAGARIRVADPGWSTGH